MTSTDAGPRSRPEPTPEPDRAATLREIEQRVLWLATAIVHHANRVRPNPSGRTPAVSRSAVTRPPAPRS